MNRASFDRPLRVVQWATGTVGIHAVPGIAAHPDLELVGLWVHSSGKVGRDAGELCGISPLGVAATDDADALLALEPDCICYTANSDVRPGGVVDDIERFLRAGIDVVNTSFVPLLYPKQAGGDTFDRLQRAGEEGGASVYTSGIDPGFGNAGLAIHTLALSKEVSQVRMFEIVNYDTWDNPFTLFEIMGFGKADPSESILLAPGSTTLAWGPVLALVAEALGWDIEDIVERHEVLRADRTFSIASGPIEKGTVSGMRFEVAGVVGGVERLVVEHVTRLRDDDAPHWPQGEGYRIEITGDPKLRLDLALDSDHGDHNHAGCLATAMHVINAIPEVVSAAPGVRTLLDLPVYSARPA